MNQRQPSVPQGLAMFVAGRSPGELLRGLEAAHDHGFHEVQLNLLWYPVARRELQEVKAKLQRHEMIARVAGVYNDLTRFDSYHFFQMSGRELKQQIELLPEIGVESIAVWSGSFQDDLLAADGRNRTAEARRTLQNNVESVLALLEEHGIKLLIEPWITHVLGSENEVAEFCSTYRGRVGSIVDIPNFIAVSDWKRRHERIPAIVESLTPSAGAVHLKDMSVRENGEFELPCAGSGQLDYDLMLSSLKPLWGKMPFVIEHMTMEQVPQVLNFLLPKLRQNHYHLE